MTFPFIKEEIQLAGDPASRHQPNQLQAVGHANIQGHFHDIPPPNIHVERDKLSTDKGVMTSELLSFISVHINSRRVK